MQGGEVCQAENQKAKKFSRDRRKVFLFSETSFIIPLYKQELIFISYLDGIV